MCSALKAILTSAVLASMGVARAPAAAQTSEEMGRAISTVMNYRRSWLDDSTRFDACSVQRALGGVADYADYIIEPVRGLLDSATPTCPRPARERQNYNIPFVLVDSVRSADTTAHVYVTVIRGELSHRENYVLVRSRSSAAYLPVRDVRLWGNGRAYPSFSDPD